MASFLLLFLIILCVFFYNRHAHSSSEAHLAFVFRPLLPPLLLALLSIRIFYWIRIICLSWLAGIEHVVDTFGPLLVLADNVIYSVFS